MRDKADPRRELRKDSFTVKAILDQLDRCAPQHHRANLRADDRYVYRPNPLTIELQDPTGTWAPYAAAARNISSSGLALLLGQFVYPGTSCRVHLVSLEKLRQTVAGRVMWCRYLPGTASPSGKGHPATGGGIYRLVGRCRQVQAVVELGALGIKRILAQAEARGDQPDYLMQLLGVNIV